VPEGCLEAYRHVCDTPADNYEKQGNDTANTVGNYKSKIGIGIGISPYTAIDLQDHSECKHQQEEKQGFNKEYTVKALFVCTGRHIEIIQKIYYSESEYIDKKNKYLSPFRLEKG
jgi:hypothetical protein